LVPAVVNDEVLMRGDRDSEINFMEMRSWQAYFEGSCPLELFQGDHFYAAENPAAAVDAILGRLHALSSAESG